MTDPTMPDAQPLRADDPERLGDYEIIGRLGEGGQGAVFLGRRGRGPGPDGLVAVKLLHVAWTTDPAARARFMRELEVAKRVARFCTAQVIDADMAGDRPYIVSEFVPGHSLDHRVEAEGPRGGGALERLAVSTLTALIAIHQAGIVHRDFKPHNVIMGPDGPRVIDFGVARALDATGETQTVGTPAYMAPEHFTAAPIGPAADLFAWGGTMVFAATGRPAFGDDGMAAVMHRILTAEPDLSALPDPLRAVVAACLAKDPELRPSAREAQERLVGAASAATTATTGTAAGTAAGTAGDRRPEAEQPGTPPGDPAAWPQPAWMFPVGDLPATPFPDAEAPRPAEGTRPAAAGAPDVAESPSQDTPSPGGQPGPAGPPGTAGGVTGVTRPGPPAQSARRAAPLIAAAATAGCMLLAGGMGWAATMRGDDSPGGSGQGAAVAAPGTTPAAGPAAGTGDPKGRTGAGRIPGASRTARPSAGTGANGSPADGERRPTGGTTTAPPGTQPGTGGGTGGGDAPERANPYTAQRVCGGGYYVQRSSGFSGGKTYQLYNTSTKKNCVVTLKTTNVGKSSKVWAKLEVQNGGTATDNGSFAYYAGPVYLTAPGKCVRYSGGTASAGTGSGWANCG